jgi:hypothetical protein
MYGYSAGQGDFFCLFSIKALSIDSSNSEARWVSGLTKLMFGWNWKAGEREICLTLALDPNNAIAHIVLSIYYFMVGESAQTVNECKRACLLDRLSPFTQPAVYFALYLAGLNKEAKQRMLENKGRLSGFFKYHGCLGFCAIQDQDWNIATPGLRTRCKRTCGRDPRYLSGACATSGIAIYPRHGVRCPRVWARRDR